MDAAENKKTATAPEDLQYNRQTPEEARSYKLLKKETYKNFYLEMYTHKKQHSEKRFKETLEFLS